MNETGLEAVARAANTIGAWCGMRDADRLTPGMADLFVLFGGGVAGTLDTLAAAMDMQVADHYAIVGGRGHATFGLVRAIETEFVDWDSEICPRPDLALSSEAEMLQAFLQQRYGKSVDFLECRSTNCGENVSFLLDILSILAKVTYRPVSIVFSQDAVMQRRMDATYRRQVQDRPDFRDTPLINWAAYTCEVAVEDGSLVFVDDPSGMWEMDHYLRLLSGEVTRLTDDERGYGPKGADFLVHVDVPAEVVAAHEVVLSYVGDERRS